MSENLLTGRTGADFDRHTADHREPAPGCVFCLDHGARDHAADLRTRALAMTEAARAAHARELALAA